VTGDSDLLDMKNYKVTQIVIVEEFEKILAENL